jgi:hypothetical protein
VQVKVATPVSLDREETDLIVTALECWQGECFEGSETHSKLETLITRLRDVQREAGWEGSK